MKYLKVLILGLALTVLFYSGCSDLLGLDGHEIRAKNKSAVTLSFKIGKISFNDVSPGETTKYKEIDEGTHQVTGDLTGSISISGSGNHQWTLTINSDGSTSVKED